MQSRNEHLFGWRHVDKLEAKVPLGNWYFEIDHENHPWSGASSVTVTICERCGDELLCIASKAWSRLRDAVSGQNNWCQASSLGGSPDILGTAVRPSMVGTGAGTCRSGTPVHMPRIARTRRGGSRPSETRGFV